MRWRARAAGWVRSGLGASVRRQERPVEIGRYHRELLIDVGRLRVGFGAHAHLVREKARETLFSCNSSTRSIGTTASWARHVAQRQVQ
jgi:hypothetical protein